MPSIQANLDFPALRDPKHPVHKIADQLEPYLRVIVEKFHPEKIILFGSYAYGEPTRHSDVDLLIVRRGISSEKESNLEIRHEFWDVPAAPLAFTLLSKTPEQVQEKLAKHSPIFEDIVGRESSFMLRKKTNEKNPEDWFSFAAERLHVADVIWKHEGLTAPGIEILQEAVERYLKGYLISKGWNLVKIHDLSSLLKEAIRFDPRFSRFKAMAAELTEDFFAQHYAGSDTTRVGEMNYFGNKSMNC